MSSLTSFVFPLFNPNAGKYDQNNAEYGHFSRKAGEELTKSLEEFYLASNVNIRGIRE